MRAVAIFRLTHHFTLAAALLLGSTACDKDSSNKPFGWVRSGTRLYYDFYGAQDTIRDVRYLAINPDNKVLNIQEYKPNTNGLTPLFGQFSDIDVKVEPKGLYERICGSCSFGSCISMSDYMVVPKKPFLYQELITYSCGSSSNGTNYIMNTDTTLTVPMGTFTVYVMQHPDGDKSYWNAREGLIMYEVRNQDRTAWRGTLRLNRIER
jgi:hypothetical protein